MGDAHEATWNLAGERHGEGVSTDELLPIVYAELRALAGHFMIDENRQHTLSPTAVVHEVYLRLIDQTCASWNGRAHFFAVASEMIRRILVDHARAKQTQKRGGGRIRVAVEPELTLGADQLDILALDEALSELDCLNKRQASVVVLRFFGGLSVKQTACVLDISPTTVKEDFRLARAWLRRRLKE